MTPVIYNDVLAAVSVVAAAQPDRQAEVIAELIHDADLAEAYRLKYRAAHPVFGDGSLIAAALRHDRRDRCSFQNMEGLTAWLCVLSALLARLSETKASGHAQERHSLR